MSVAAVVLFVLLVTDLILRDAERLGEAREDVISNVAAAFPSPHCSFVDSQTPAQFVRRQATRLA
jgi:hypothetical protein